jgi:hypothetical protein
MQEVRDPIARELGALRQRVLDPLRRVARARERPPTRATFDPVKVEAEFYDSIYGPRSGTVDNVAPVDSEPPAG